MASIIDKKNLFCNPLPDQLVLELGCGDRKKNDHAIGVDQLDFPCVDLVGDVFEILDKFPDHSVDKIVSFHFLEHVNDLSGLLAVFSRILKKGGMIEATVPHFSSPYYYSDPTHKNQFGLYTFCYFTGRHPLARTVPTYGVSFPFEIAAVNLIFKSPKPFYFRYAFKRAVGAVFNSSVFMKEFWEENLCYLFPCYEVEYRIKIV